jgi:hypothetical protein
MGPRAASAEGGRRTFAGAAGAAALLAAALVVAGCARRPLAPPATVYPYGAAAEKVFFATNSGLSELTFQGEAEAELPASRAPNASVLSADGRDILVAVNGWGIERIEPSTDGKAYRLVDAPLPAFSGLTTGGAWPLNGGFLVQFYRDPFQGAASAGPDEGDAAGRGAAAMSRSAGGGGRQTSPRLAFIAGEGGAITTPNPFPPGLDSAFEAFALLPAGGKWFSELRKDGPEKVELKFFVLEGPLAAPSLAREIRRSEFEAALRPLPLSAFKGEVGTALRSALGALGDEPWLARLRSGDGEDRWYLSSGLPEEATNVYAWSLAPAGNAPARVLALVGDGRLAVAGLGSASVRTLGAPVEGAAFTALAAAGRIAAAAWEAGLFPNLSSAGIVVVPIP